MRRSLYLFLASALLLGACAGGGAGGTAVDIGVWLDQPVSGTILPPGVFVLKAHARHAAGRGITRIEFLVNGLPIGAIATDSAAPLAYGETNWNATIPGEYTVVARAYAGNRFADSAPAKVCVSREVQAPVVSPTGGCKAPQKLATPVPQAQPTATAQPAVTLEPTKTPIPPTKTPIPPTKTPIPPTKTPIPPTNTPIPPTATFTPIPKDSTPPQVSITLIEPKSKVLWYRTRGCGSSILVVEAYVNDEQSGVAEVTLIRSYVGSGAGGILAPMTPIGGNYYRIEVDVLDEAYTFFGSSGGVLRVVVYARDNAGNSAESAAIDFSVYYCLQ
jgi:hypothetical protein